MSNTTPHMPTTPLHQNTPISVYRIPAPPEKLLRLGTILGVILFIGGVGWTGALRGQDLYEAWFQTEPFGWLWDIGLGLLLGVAFSLILWFGGESIQGFQRIRAMLVERLDFAAMRPWHIVTLSFVAAVPEEIFFRGAMQPVIGLIFTAIIFGALHAITRLYFVYAVFAGLGLGLLADWQGTLWLPIATHFAVDVLALWFLTWWAGQQRGSHSATHDFASKGEPSLLS